MIELTLDARGLICPLPVLKARKILLGAAGSVRLTVQVSDPATETDFRLFCEEAGIRWMGATATDTGALFYLEKTID